jgi:type IV pilus assembly protein PilP
MGKMCIRFIILLTLALLFGCTAGQGFVDLDNYIAEVKARPKSRIEPLPKFNAYEAFSYRAANRRSPFTEPLAIEQSATEDKPKSNIKPDFDRVKDPLEFFSIGSMSMVGTIRKENENTLYALISDSQGGVHRVRLGNYMGKNHGKIVELSEGLIRLVEIVSDGQGGWFERPRTMGLKDN